MADNERFRLYCWAGLRWAGLDWVELSRPELGCAGLGMGWVALSWAELGWVRPRKFVNLCLRRQQCRAGAGHGWGSAGLRNDGLGWAELGQMSQVLWAIRKHKHACNLQQMIQCQGSS